MLKVGTKGRIVNATGATKDSFNGATTEVTGRGKTFFDRRWYSLGIDYGTYVWFDEDLEVIQ